MASWNKNIYTVDFRQPCHTLSQLILTTAFEGRQGGIFFIISSALKMNGNELRNIMGLAQPEQILKRLLFSLPSPTFHQPSNSFLASFFDY